MAEDPRIAIVTDSTAYLPPVVAERHGIQVVPVQVVVGGHVYDEGVDITSDRVADALRDWQPVSTSRPSPRRFLDAYETAAANGAPGIVSVHLSADMSGTGESAMLAARDSPVPVRVVDSRSIGMALGFAALTAADVAQNAAPMDEVVSAAEKRAAGATTLFYVDTLEYLRRGGRIGAAQALLGSALAVKPLLHVVDGRIAPLEKVRTKSRALARLEEIALERAGTGPVDIAVHHLANAARAQVLSERLRERLPQLNDLYVREVGAVVGAHVGPGMLAVVIAPR